VCKETGLKTMSVGHITDARQAEEVVASGIADFVVLGRAVMCDPRWAWHAAEAFGAETAYAPKMMACHPKMRPQVFPNRQTPAT
jgi:NADPH2 dehydrogenase